MRWSAPGAQDSVATASACIRPATLGLIVTGIAVVPGGLSR